MSLSVMRKQGTRGQRQGVRPVLTWTQERMTRPLASRTQLLLLLMLMLMRVLLLMKLILRFMLALARRALALARPRESLCES